MVGGRSGNISGKEGLMYLCWRRHGGCERFAFEHEKTLAGKRMDFFFFFMGEWLTSQRENSFPYEKYLSKNIIFHLWLAAS